MKDAWKNRVKVTFLIYIIALLYMLLFAERHVTNSNGYNVRLFAEIGRYIKYRDILGMELVVRNLAGNVVGFLPFGFLLPCLYTRFQKVWKTTLLAALFSLAIELVQLISGVGCFDVDDIFLNMLGGMFGYLLWLCWKQIRKNDGKNKEEKKI